MSRVESVGQRYAHHTLRIKKEEVIVKEEKERDQQPDDRCKLISRRGFLTGAAATGAIAALSGLAACSPSQAPKDGGSGASGTSSEAGNGKSSESDWLGNEPQIADKDITETIETEILIIGGGTGGLFAACAAGEEGAKTLVIDKLQSGGIRDDLGGINTRLMKETGTVIDKQEITQACQSYSANRINASLHHLWYDNSAETIDWYQDRLAEHDVTLWQEYTVEKDKVNYKHFATGHSPAWPKDDKGKALLDGKTVLTEYATGLGVEFRYNTPMVKLIKDGDRVAGAIAKADSGSYVRINASKGVIVATGGYAMNRDMLAALQPEAMPLIAWNTAIPGSEGDGIKACIWAGADFDKVHTSMLFDRGAIKPDQVSGGDWSEGRLFWLGSQPLLKVNLNGERFTNESGPYDFITHASAFQPQATYCTIWDGNIENDIPRFDTHGCSRMLPNDNGAPPNIPMPAVLGMVQGLIEEGYVQQADTIEELAEKLNIPADTFKKTVDRYNELFDMQEDPDFGKEAFRLSELRKPPFYGVRQNSMILCTLDGIRINTDLKALDPQGKPIEGLYVVGNDSGGYYAYTYPNMITGHACGRTITFARLAAKKIANG
ncbi:MAG: FAD-binding protein [Coriobacteriaceae bacterium]|nr:FAD-binding protein [Coriobacteriaceae bacterium]